MPSKLHTLVTVLLIPFIKIIIFSVLPEFLVDITVHITPFGSAIAGERYSLRCSVTVTESTPQPTVHWRDPMNNLISLNFGHGQFLATTVTFYSLAASDMGTYTCVAALGSAIDTVSRSRFVAVQSKNVC